MTDRPRLVPFDPDRRPPPDADMSFIDPPDFKDTRGGRARERRWIVRARTVATALLAVFATIAVAMAIWRGL